MPYKGNADGSALCASGRLDARIIPWANKAARPRLEPLCIVLFHPDYTVGSGIAPDLLTLPKEALAGSGIASDTAGGELHPALRTSEV